MSWRLIIQILRKRLCQELQQKYIAVLNELSDCQQRNRKLSKAVTQLHLQLAPPKAPEIKDKISAQEIINLYAEIFPQHQGKIFISDSEYEITAISEIRRFIDWDNTDKYGYTKQTHDCDDFAIALAGSFAKYPEWSGFPTTDIWADGHAFFTCVAWPSFEDKTPTVYYIEPQSDVELAAEQVEDMALWLLVI